MTERVLVIDPDGTVRAVYSDRLPLRALGRISVERASRVEFNADWQTWVATEIATGRILAEGTSREAVIEAEIRALQEAL